MKCFLSIIILFFCLSAKAQQTDYVDFKKIEALIVFNQFEVDSTTFNSYDIKFDILKSKDSIFLDAVNMKFDHVALNGSKVDFRNDGKKLIIYNNFEKNQSYNLSFIFFNSPKKAMYFIGWDNKGRNQIWTQGQGKYTSNWLPSIDDTNDKIEFDLKYVTSKNYSVIGNGKLISKSNVSNKVLWEYNMDKPMPSYLVALAIGKYSKKVEYSKSGTPLEMYYYPEDSAKVEPTYRYTKKIFDFLEDEIGFDYPWQNYKQVPVKDFLYAGMENTSLTIFSDAFIVDEVGFADKNYVNVNAHELAHQWFGNLVTAKSGEHHWLQEGFATYYALLAERDIFGNEYALYKLQETAQQLRTQDKSRKGTSLLNPKSSSLTFYQRGAWVLHALRWKIGKKTFKKAVKNYLEKHQFLNVETQDFISEAEKESEQDLSSFVKLWIESERFPYDEAMEILKNSVYIQEYLMVDCEVKNSKCHEYLESTVSDEAKIKIITQSPNLITTETFKNSLKVRQSIALNLNRIPSKLKVNYESLLNDKSYVTIESALFNLWNNFKEDRIKYLNRTKEIHGFSDKNVRTLWLTLALLTDDFEPENDESYFNELENYTNSSYGFEVRQNAFKMLAYISSCADKCEENLKEATKHHNWRFKNFAKNLLKSF